MKIQINNNKINFQTSKNINNKKLVIIISSDQIFISLLTLLAPNISIV